MFLSRKSKEAQVLIDKFIPSKMNQLKKMVKIKYDLKSFLILTCRRKIIWHHDCHYLINPDMRHNMDILSKPIWNTLKIHQDINWKKRQESKNQWGWVRGNKRICSRRCWRYLSIKQFFCRIGKNWDKKTFEEIEIPLVKVLADMEKKASD
jgi:DNA polymerase-1